MKRIFSIILTAASAMSCGFLTLDESVYTSEKYQFAYFDNVKMAATNVYSYLEDGFFAVGNTMRECATDDAVYAWESGSIKTYYDGTWSQTNTIDDKWGYYYKAISAANYFLKNCPEDFPEAIYVEDYNNAKKQLELFPYEVRFLRAFFHFELLKRYDNIVVVEKSLTTEEVNTLKQSSFENVVEWIVNECDEIAPKLPKSYEDSYYKELGRVTKGAVMALKARVLLYAASPLHNASGDKALYLKAAQAAAELIELGQYQLVREETVNNADAKGLIFGIRRSPDKSFESANFPMGIEGGNSGVNPSQDLAEAFDMLDGTPFDWSDGMHRSRMFDPGFRDPRFGATFYYNGASFKGKPLETFYGGANGRPIEGATATSYYLKKFVQEDTGFLSNSASYPHVWPVFRYAEVWLEYAEALFLATDNKDFKGSYGGYHYKYSPLEAVNAVRERAGVGLLPAGLTSAQFMKRLKNEYRVEFAFEDHRFWDLRRWKDAGNSMTVHGLEILDPNAPDRAVKVVVRSSRWDDRMYFYPISRSEIFKNHNLEQNLGW